MSYMDYSTLLPSTSCIIYMGTEGYGSNLFLSLNKSPFHAF